MAVFFHAIAQAPEQRGEFPAFLPRREPYAISRLVSEQILSQQMTLSTLAERLGFQKPKQGIAAITRVVFDAECSREFLDALPRALAIDETAVATAVEETNREIAAEAERYRKWQAEREIALFCPCLEVLHQYERPTPCLPCDYSGYKFLVLPADLPAHSWADQCTSVRAKIHSHYEATSGTPFGYVTGYRYRQSLGVAIKFNTAGAPEHTP